MAVRPRKAAPRRRRESWTSSNTLRSLIALKSAPLFGCLVLITNAALDDRKLGWFDESEASAKHIRTVILKNMFTPQEVDVRRMSLRSFFVTNFSG